MTTSEEIRISLRDYLIMRRGLKEIQRPSEAGEEEIRGALKFFTISKEHGHFPNPGEAALHESGFKFYIHDDHHYPAE